MAINKNNTLKAKPENEQKKVYKSKFQEPTTSLIYIIPFICTIVIIPLIVHYKEFLNNLSSEYWHSSQATTTDIFLYWKSVYLIVFGVILLFLVLTALVITSKKFKFEIEYAPLTVYLVFVLLSTMVSQNINFSLHGIENHFESMWVLLAYIILAIYGAIMIDNTTAIKIVIYGWLAGTWVLMLIGVFQTFKLDIFTTEFIKYIVFPKELRGNSLSLNFPLGQAYITLYNPNYVGYFIGVTIPVFLTLAFFVKEYWKKALFGVTVIGLFICAAGSGAKNGFLSLAGSFLFLLIMFRKQILKYWYVIVLTIVILVGLFFGINAARGNALIYSLQGAIDVLLNKTENTRHVDSIKCEKDSVNITYDGQVYKMKMLVDENSNIAARMYDSSNEEISTKLSDDQTSYISDDKAFPFTIKPVNYGMQDGSVIPSLELTVDGFSYAFSNQLNKIYSSEEGYYYLNASGKWLTIEEPEAVLFNKNPKIFSNRGFIWARTIPLLKEHVIVGSGPDTFALQYPNFDYVNAAYVGFLNQIVTKPHSLYLQIGVQTGVISMLAFIVFFMIYFIRSIILYWKHPLDTLISKLGIGLAAGLLGYMISGITNDSTITYAPVFWGMMGVGIALNRLVRNEYAARPTAEE